MANPSKRAKNHARVKRENSLLKRALQQQEMERVKSVSLLLMLLAKQGGDVTLEREFLETVKGQIGFMGYQHTVAENGDLQVKVVLNEEAMREALAAAAEEAHAQGATPTPEPPQSAIVLTDGE